MQQRNLMNLRHAWPSPGDISYVEILAKSPGQGTFVSSPLSTVYRRRLPAILVTVLARGSVVRTASTARTTAHCDWKFELQQNIPSEAGFKAICGESANPLVFATLRSASRPGNEVTVKSHT